MIDLFSLLAICAPFVEPSTMHAVVMTESRGNPWSIGINASKTLPKPKRVRPSSYQEAVWEAERLIGAGYNIDMGYAQINSRTMRDLGLTVTQVFDPCTNLYAGATVLWRFYMRSEKKFGRNQQALLAAFSAYNTGNFKDGFRNGYVDRIVNSARQ